MKNETLRVTTIFTSSMLGATYLSGYEWLRFFSSFGTWGSVGLLFAVLVLTWLTYRMATLIHEHHLSSLPDFLAYFFGPAAAPTFSFVFILLFLAFGGLVVAEQAKLTAMYTRLPILPTVLIPAVLIFLLARLGLARIAWYAQFSLLTGIGFIAVLLVQQAHIPVPSLAYQLNAQWVWNAMLFVALHVFLALAILIPLVSKTQDFSSLCHGIVLGGIACGLIAFAVHFAILGHWHDVHNTSQPLMQMVAGLFPGGTYLYALLFLVHTSIVLAMMHYGVAVPFTEQLDLRLTPTLLLALGITLLFSFLPIWTAWYSVVLYTLITYIGLLFLTIVVRKLLSTK